MWRKNADAAFLSGIDATCSYVNIDYASLNAIKDVLTTSSNDKQEAL